MNDRRRTTMVGVPDRSREGNTGGDGQPEGPASDAFVPMSRSGLADQLAEHLLADVVAGVYPPDSQLPPEPELASLAGVSRLTLREAIKDLRQRGVLRVLQGRGTFVNQPQHWSAFDTTVLNARASLEQGYDLALELTELRRVVERGIAELAAIRRSDDDITRLAAALDAMKTAWTKRDMDAFSNADVDFHDALLRAAGNTFALTLFHSVDDALRRVRRRTVENPELAQRALEAHDRILGAIRRKSAPQAGRTMNDHLQFTEDFIANLAAKAKSARSSTA